MGAPETIFAEEFDLAGCHCTRRSKPSGHLAPTRVHHGLTLPGDFGRAVLDVFAYEGRPVARLVSMKYGDVAWYDVAIRPLDKPVAGSLRETPDDG